MQNELKKNQLKVKLFTHNDLDGIGCAIVGKCLFEDQLNIQDIKYCHYANINKIIKEYLESDDWKNYDYTFITDISVNEDTAELIEKYFNEHLYFNMQLIDHHKTALFLQKYSWANVTIEDDKGLCSGTSLFLDFLELKQMGYIQKNNVNINIHNFAEIVRKYDTWEWENIYKDNTPKQYNDLYYILGKSKFIQLILNKLVSKNEMCFSQKEHEILDLEYERIQKYIQLKNQDIIKIDIKDYVVGVVFAEQYISELGNKLCEYNNDVDLIAIINPSKSISYRTIKPDVDVSQIAEIFGGGGHIKASGSNITDKQRKNILKILFQI